MCLVADPCLVSDAQEETKDEAWLNLSKNDLYRLREMLFIFVLVYFFLLTFWDKYGLGPFTFS